MATNYIVINCKESKFEGADNIAITCYSSDKGKYLMCGSNTETLKMVRDDFIVALRVHGYELDDLPQKVLTPVFGRYDRVEDFVLSDPKTGEVLGNA